MAPVLAGASRPRRADRRCASGPGGERRSRRRDPARAGRASVDALDRFAPDVVLDLMGNHKAGVLAALTLGDRRIGLARAGRREPSSAVWISEPVVPRGRRTRSTARCRCSTPWASRRSRRTSAGEDLPGARGGSSCRAARRSPTSSSIPAPAGPTSATRRSGGGRWRGGCARRPACSTWVRRRPGRRGARGRGRGGGAAARPGPCRPRTCRPSRACSAGRAWCWAATPARPTSPTPWAPRS